MRNSIGQLRTMARLIAAVILNAAVMSVGAGAAWAWDEAADCAAMGETRSVFPDRVWLRGFSIVPPTGAGWCKVSPNRFGSSFVVRLHMACPPANRGHTYLMSANLVDVDADVPSTLPGLEALIKRWISAGAVEVAQLSGKMRLEFGPTRSSERITFERGTAAPDLSIGLECVRYDLRYRERDNPLMQGLALTLDARGLLCLLPGSPTELLQLGDSERYPADHPPALLLMTGHEKEARTFLESFLLAMPENTNSANHMRVAAERGVVQAEFSLGLLEQYRARYSEALSWYSRAAKADHLGAINNLGVLYYNGLGVARDYTEAARWFDRAAARGAAEAQFQLGLMYWLGQGVPADEAVAVRLMRTAANQGFPIAMINMGDIYRDGNGGTPIDLVRAYGWYMMGLERAKGDPHLEAIAERSLEALQSTLSTAQINAAKTWADEWAPGTN